MRVFVTGASGHVGSAVVPELLRAGHEVVGLARSDASAEKLAASGADVVRGDLADHEVLRKSAAEADGVIHLAFNHEWMRGGTFADSLALDRAAIDALTEPLVGTGRPFVGTSGTAGLAGLNLGRTATERDVVPGGPRADAENAAIALADQGVRTSVLRLPPTVHSDLDRHGFVPMIIAAARRAGVAAYVGDGANRWPAGHTRDAAALYRLAVEGAPAGSRLHAVGDEGVSMREIAEAIGRALDLPVRSIEPQDAEAQFGFLAPFVQADNPTSSALTKELLGWRPTRPGLIADLEAGHYFADA
jgi:nucleoside-diphosphate-sugar epimerase